MSPRIFTLILLVLLSCSTRLTAQVGFICGYNSVGPDDPIFKKDLCQFFGAVSDKQAGTIVESIMGKIGVSNSIKIVPCFKIKNCYAWFFADSENPGQYILYDPAFLDKITNTASSDWGAKCVLAHEVAHILFGHTFRRQPTTPALELMADKWSGYAMYKLGASAKELMDGVNDYADEGATSTHPSRYERKEAVLQGYNEAKAEYERNAGGGSNVAAARASYQKGRAAGDPNDQVRFFTEAISLNGNFEDAYYQRALAYYNLKKRELAIADLNEAIALNPLNSQYHYQKGYVYHYTDQYQEAVQSINKALSLEPGNLTFLGMLASTYYYMRKLDDCIKECNTIIERDKTSHNAFYFRGKCHHYKKNYSLAISDLSQAINLSTTEASAWYSRAMVYIDLKNYQAALVDLNKAKEINSTWKLVDEQIESVKKLIGTQAAVFGNITRTWIGPDDYKNGEKGMYIYTNFNVNNMTGVRGLVSVYFYYADGTPLPAAAAPYRTSHGKLAASENFYPQNTGATYNDFKIFIPYSAFNAPVGVMNLKYEMLIWEYSTSAGQVISRSDHIPFTLTTTR